MWETFLKSFADLSSLPSGAVARLMLDRFTSFQVNSVSIVSEEKIAITGSGINALTSSDVSLHFFKKSDGIYFQYTTEDSSELLPMSIETGTVMFPDITRRGTEIPILIPSDLCNLEIGKYLIFHFHESSRLSFRISKLSMTSETEVSGLSQILKTRGNLPSGSQVLFSFSLKNQTLSFGEENLVFKQCFWVESLRHRRGSRSSDSDSSSERNASKNAMHRNASWERLCQYEIPDRPRSRSGGKEIPKPNNPM